MSVLGNTPALTFFAASKAEKKDMKAGHEQFLLRQFMTPGEDFHLARTSIHSNHDLRLHSHDYAEVFWINEGSGMHLIDGQRIRIAKGDLWMIRPHDVHTFEVNPAGDALVITNLAFPMESLEHYRMRYFKDAQDYFWTEDTLPYHRKLRKEQLLALKALTERMLQAPRTPMQLDVMMLQLFGLFSTQNHSASGLPTWLQHAMDAYATPEQFHKGTDGFIQLCDRSYDHVNRSLKKHMDLTLTECINQIRLNYAAQLLSMTNAPIKSIAMDCGFGTTHYFHRLFKKQMGMTPQDYRHNNAKMF